MSAAESVSLDGYPKRRPHGLPHGAPSQAVAISPVGRAIRIEDFTRRSVSDLGNLETQWPDMLQIL